MLKNLIYRVIIPFVAIILTYFLIINLKSVLENEKTDIKILRNITSVSPSINWLIGWSDQPIKKNTIEEFIDNYSFNNQRLKINLGHSENKNTTRQAREIVRMIENNLYDWDIVWIDESVYKQVGSMLMMPDWGKEYLVDFQNIEGFRLTQNPEIVNNVHIMQKMGNVLTGPFLEGFYGVLWYNKSVAKTLGLEIKDREMNFKDILKYAQQVEKHNINSENKIALFCESRQGSINILFQNLVWAEMGKNNLLNGDSVKFSPENILSPILDLFEQLSKYSPLIESHNVFEEYEAKEAFLENKALFMLGKTEMINELKSIDKEAALNILPAELPFISDNYNVYLGDFQPSFAIFKSAPNRNEAIELINSISSPVFANRWTELTKNPTGIASDIKENYLQNDPYKNFLIYIAKKYNYNVRYSIDAGYLLGSNNTNLNYLIQDNIRMLLAGQIGSGEFVNNIKNNISW